jgi:hypothetical protein
VSTNIAEVQGAHVAEALLGGVLRGEEEENAASTTGGSQAFAAAVAANLANHSPEVATATAAFFREQSKALLPSWIKAPSDGTDLSANSLA